MRRKLPALASITTNSPDPTRSRCTCEGAPPPPLTRELGENNLPVRPMELISTGSVSTGSPTKVEDK